MVRPSKGHKRAGMRRGKGNEAKKGQAGIAAQYITRNKAIKKLQISLKDFRRLCILKGIYPRDPRKKKAGKDKTYYHIKDIKFLSHEPLLMKFRSMKIFLKKHNKALHKGDYSKAVQLTHSIKPSITLSHLVRERYPSFNDALNDLDDSLSMCALFSMLPCESIPTHDIEKIENCGNLVYEFHSYIIFTKLLYKVFVSIKGIYYQALVNDVPITWLIPHAYKQELPTDVDYRIMSTFLDFYETLLKFVNCQLYWKSGKKYPPIIGESRSTHRLTTRALIITDSTAPPATSASKPIVKLDATKHAQQQRIVNATINSLKKKKLDEKQANIDDENDEQMQDVENDASNEIDEFSSNTNLTPQENDMLLGRTLFANLVFLLSRETPQASLEFVVLCGGGTAIFEHELNDSNRGTITHVVLDRPAVRDSDRGEGREYVQPQWVYDSFNARVLLPIHAYAVGAVPPPHLSPFINDEQEGYIPSQRKVLREWGAKCSWWSTTASNDEQKGEEEEIDEEQAERLKDEQAEKKYNEELKKERKGMAFSKAEEEEEAAEEDDDDDEEEEEEEEVDADAASDDDEEEAPVAKRGAKRKSTASEAAPGDELAQSQREREKMLMRPKAARLLQRMEYGINKKKEKNEQLAKKAQEIEKSTKKNAKQPQASKEEEEKPAATPKRKKARVA